jgi:hypothetical protein
MSVLCEPNKQLNDLGIGKCSVPMWMNGCPAGFCDEPAYGLRPDSKEYMNYCINEMQRVDGRYAGYVPALACCGHGGPKSRVFRDGNMFCAVFPDFINLQESPAGFGPTEAEARTELREVTGKATD